MERQKSEETEKKSSLEISSSSEKESPPVELKKEEKSAEPIDGKEYVTAPEALSVSSSPNSTRTRRKSIPERPEIGLNLFSLIKNAIGSDITKIPMPVSDKPSSNIQVNFNEPLSMLQRLTEDLEYSELLTEAVGKESLAQMCYVAAFAISNYSTTGDRPTKPFNPLLGETYECDRMADRGFRSFAEQAHIFKLAYFKVSHHPPAVALHAEGRGWMLDETFTLNSKLRGSIRGGVYLNITPSGSTNITFDDDGNHYSYSKITTTVHNLMMGKLWIDNHGEMVIKNHTTGEKCSLKFKEYSYFTRDIARKVTGVIKDKDNVSHYVVHGVWDSHVEILKVVSVSAEHPNSIKTEIPKCIWRVAPRVINAEKMYNFSTFALELNEMEDSVAPTDSRLRPDQRLMENGKWDEANKVKQLLEKNQRIRLKNAIDPWTPVWFEKRAAENSEEPTYKFTDQYWTAKQANDWRRCPAIFD